MLVFIQVFTPPLSLTCQTVVSITWRGGGDGQCCPSSLALSKWEAGDDRLRPWLSSSGRGGGKGEGIGEGMGEGIGGEEGRNVLAVPANRTKVINIRTRQ
jgi:hypothetical protein